MANTQQDSSSGYGGLDLSYSDAIKAAKLQALYQSQGTPIILTARIEKTNSSPLDSTTPPDPTDPPKQPSNREPVYSGPVDDGEEDPSEPPKTNNNNESEWSVASPSSWSNSTIQSDKIPSSVPVYHSTMNPIYEPSQYAHTSQSFKSVQYRQVDLNPSQPNSERLKPMTQVASQKSLHSVAPEHAQQIFI